MGKVAIWGASGAIGESVASALRAQGTPYRVVGRSRASLERIFGSDPLAEIVTWDPEDAQSVRAAAAGIGTIVYTVGVDYWRFELHPQLIRATLAGAIAEHVERFLLVATIYSYGRGVQANPVREDHPREPHTFKGKMRLEQEEILLDADRAGKIKGAVLRLPDFYGPGVEKSFLDGLFNAAVSGKTANMLGPIDVPHEFVYVPDVGPVIVRLIEEPQAYGRVLHLAGAGSTTQRAIVDRVEREVGHPVKILVAGKTMLRMLGLFNPMMRELADMHYLLAEPIIMDDSAITELIGPIQKTSYDDGVRQVLASLREPSPVHA
jgi:nucleoside-diphosphate-sugar epimerase